MSTISIDKSRQADLILRRGADQAFNLTFTQGGSAFAITAYTFVAEFFREGSSTPILTLTQGGGLTNNGATGVLAVSITATQLGIPADRYWWRLRHTAPTAAVVVSGDVTINDGVYDDTYSNTVPLTVNLGANSINLAVTLAGVANVALVVACSDETTDLTTGTAKATFRMPFAMTLTAVRASLTTAQASGSLLTVDINQNGTSVISTKLTFDNTEKTTTTSATPAVISTTALTDDAEITVDIDQVGTAGARGLKVSLIGVRV